MGTADLKIPIIDLSSPEKSSTSRLIRKACLDHGFFYLTNHGVSEELMEGVLRESNKLFSLSLYEKMAMMARRGFRGYSPIYGEKFESSSTSKGDSKEMFSFGSSDGDLGQLYPNEWPPEDLLPLWRPTMESHYRNVMVLKKRVSHSPLVFFSQSTKAWDTQMSGTLILRSTALDLVPAVCAETRMGLSGSTD